MLDTHNINQLKWKDFCPPNDYETPIYIAPRTPQEQFPLHNHDFDELIYVYKGFGINFFKNQFKLILPGHVFFYQANHSHAYPCSENLYLLNLLINKANFSEVYHYFQELSNQLNNYQQQLFPIPLSYHDFLQLRSLVDKIKNEVIHHDQYSYMMISSIFKELVILVMRSLQEGRTHNTPQQKTGHGYFKLLVNSHLTHIFTYEAFKHILSENKVNERKFKTYLLQITGLTPYKLIQYNRVILFANLYIENPQQNIEDLCYKVGYQDYRSFSRNISGIFGASPRNVCNYLKQLSAVSYY